MASFRILSNRLLVWHFFEHGYSCYPITAESNNRIVYSWMLTGVPISVHWNSSSASSDPSTMHP
jgi:hypothetical protein